jgi:hypothetical protein
MTEDPKAIDLSRVQIDAEGTLDTTVSSEKPLHMGIFCTVHGVIANVRECPICSEDQTSGGND